MGWRAAGGEPLLDLGGEVGELVGGLGRHGEDVGGPPGVEVGLAVLEEGADVLVVARGEVGGDGRGPGLAVAEGGGGNGVEEAGEEATAAEAGLVAEGGEDPRLDGEADGEGGLGDEV